MKSIPPKSAPFKHEQKLTFLCLGLYFACLFIPAYSTTIPYSSSSVYFGWAALALGPIGLFCGHYSWLANVLLWISWVQYGRGKNASAAIVASISLAVAISFLFKKSIPEGSSGEYPFEVLWGYYVWLSSITTTMLVSALAYGIRGNAVHTSDPQ